MGDYLYILPELLLLVVVLWALFAEKLLGGDRGAAFLGFIVATASAVIVALQPIGGTLFGGLLYFDGASRFVRIAVAALTAIWVLWVAGKKDDRTREAVAVAALVAMGAMFLASAQELITMFVCIELMTLPGYILIGYRRNDRLSLEGALKYFLLSMTTSLVMLYGFSLLYGTAGTTRFEGLSSAGGLLPAIATILVLAGLFAKLSAAPFHFWAPDAYEGADSWLVAFVSTVPKIATMMVLVRLAIPLLPGSTEVLWFLILVSALSIILGNLSALGQHDVRRMMAYSGVAQIGYALMGVVAFSPISLYAGLYFMVCYAIAAMGVLLAISSDRTPTFKKLAGYGKDHPWIGACATILLLSLIGIPPLAGFMGKFYLFAGVIGSGNTYLWLVILAIVGSVVSAAYYLRLVKAMFFDTPVEDQVDEIIVIEDDITIEPLPNGDGQVIEEIIEKKIPLDDPAEEMRPARNVFAGIALTALVLATVALGVFSSQVFDFLLKMNS